MFLNGRILMMENLFAPYVREEDGVYVWPFFLCTIAGADELAE